jgi:hypothetical protein
MRHHLRHQFRVRFRLPPRQRHRHHQGRAGPARPLPRHHRRSGLDPHRRRPHPAHHQRSIHPGLPSVRHLQAARRATREAPDGTLQCLRRRGEAHAGTRRHHGCRLALFKLKLGQPRNRQFMRFMEDPEMRRLLEKTELSFQQGPFKRMSSNSRRNSISSSMKRRTTPI